MAISTVLAVGIGLIANGALLYAKVDPALSWIVAGVVAIIVGYATKGMKV